MAVPTTARAPYELGGRVALVTGAGRGIGRATAELLSACGCAVAVNDRDEGSCGEVAERLAPAHGALAVPGDVSSESEVNDVVGRARSAFSRIDFLVNNAGISRYRPISDCSEADWDEHLDVMAKGTFLMIRAVAPGMLDQRFGRIVNLGSYVAQL